MTGDRERIGGQPPEDRPQPVPAEDTPLADEDVTYEEADRKRDRLSPAAMGGAGGSGAGTEWPSKERPPEEPAPGSDPKRAAEIRRRRKEVQPDR